MNIEDMLKNMNPQMLSNAMQQMGNILTPQQMNEISRAIKNTDKGELNKKLNNLSTADLQRELQKNPMLAKQLANNPQVMQKINDIFKK